MEKLNRKHGIIPLHRLVCGIYIDYSVSICVHVSLVSLIIINMSRSYAFEKYLDKIV
jgi:hypothetical protein